MTHSLKNSFVLITGASSGIGVAFAHEYARAGYSLVVTARNGWLLESLASELRTKYGVAVEVLVADLMKADDVAQLVHRIQHTEKPVEVLVNNAGFGLGKSFHDATAEQHLAQVDVLARVPLQLMHSAIVSMRERGRGKIINVASVAAFTPGGTYSAVKRFVVSMSESANLQYASQGLLITAVCPSLTHSEFHRNMQATEPKLPRNFWLTPEYVAQQAIAANNAGKAVVIPSLTYKVLVRASRILPRKMVGMAIAGTRDY
ncbi:MAG: SDR family NAD(P)-dependent oxidoreductase [Rothia sp. (in: high G+C Gram-positive bacteria)]|nr:SDR family NAD(P)-dependent oxidoreductase [Rothia sp. (in: high G+C Gram-positive bacteria)]